MRTSVSDPALRTISLAAAALTFGVHLAVAGRYDFFRDELYFIVAGRHPAFGYVDQPPLIPLLSAATQAFGHNLVLLRLLPALAAAATVLVACALARLAGGGRYAVALAGLAVATCPMYIGIGATFNTSAFEPLAWTLVAYLFARAAYLDDRRALVWAGVVVGIELEAKYQLPFYLLPLLAAVALTPARRLLVTPEAALGALIAIVLAAPSVIWQWQHGLPFVELLRAGASGKNEVYSPVAFVLNQAGVMNLLFAPVWITGVVATCVAARLRMLRFLGFAFVLTFIAMMVLHAKDYYLAGLYAPMFALGAVVIEAALRPRALRIAYALVGAAFGILVWPAALPILDPPQLEAYLVAVHLQPQQQEKSFEGQRIPQGLADQLGWRDLEKSVAAVYRALPPDERSRAAILASNYGEAGAIDFFGGTDGLPPALSGHNTYYLWGPRGYDGSIIIRVNSYELDFWKKHCRSATVVARFGTNPYVEPYEHDRPIILCRGFFESIDAAWPLFKDYN